LLLSGDLRYMDYGSAQLLGDAIQNGGAGWESIWVVALGARYCVTDRISVQAGYIYNQNPVPENLALFNTQLPCIITNTISAGTYYQATDSIGVSLAYIHGFKNSITGTVLQ